MLTICLGVGYNNSKYILTFQHPPETNVEVQNVNEVTNFEDSDDSVKDRDYQCESEGEDSTSRSSLSDNGNDNTEAAGHTDMLPESERETYKGRLKKGRKRKYKGQDRKLRKKSNSNLPYYSAKGKFMDQRSFIDYQCKCKNQCYLKISAAERENFFTSYWNLADYNTQTTFLSTYVKENPTKRKRKSLDSEKRNFARTYLLGNNHQVCRDMFINTLQISTKRINTALCKVRTLAIPDKRGIAGGHNKMSNDQRNAVISHINKVPRYKSHYCRASTNNQEFLSIGTTLPFMYKLYKEENENIVSLSSYRKIFLTEFNLKTKALKKDTCNRCDTLKAKLQSTNDNEELQRLNEEKNIHLLEAENARKQMEADLKGAHENDDLETLTFDMEKTLPLPRLSTNIIFYKRQLWLYNCGIHSGKNNKGFCYLWIEGQAGRGAQEVGSCLRSHVKNNVSDTVKYLTLWSDSCGGQNRNIKMVLLLKCILEECGSLESIQLKFLTSGHSFLPNDSDFGDIECALKRQQRLYSPQDYADIMKVCRTKNPLEVTFLNRDDFVSTAKIEKQITNRKKDIDEMKINWLHMKEIKVQRDKPYSLFVKNIHNSSEYSEINIRKRQGRPRDSDINFSNNLERLWPNGKPVAQAKLDDIRSYMHLIPAADQGFYLNLIGDTSIEEDIEGYNVTALDFDVETEN